MTDAETETIVKTLRAGGSVDCALEGGGRLHIERPLPFLCVYRRQADHAEPDTETLLTTQAAYLIAPVETDLSELLCALTHYHQQAFGAYLILELWNGRTHHDTPPPHAFHIVSPPHHAPAELLEEMETALLRVTIHRQQPRISVDYRDETAAPGLPPLLSTARRAECGCTALGLEISPVYRDPGSGKTFIFAHRAFRRRLNRALKRIFYLFAHRCTTHRPPHYHALGPRVVTPAVRTVDAALARIGDGFDLLLHVTPVNSEQAWLDFRRHHCEREVEFLYRPRTIDPDLMKRQLYAIELEAIEDPTLADIFAAKRNELDRQITLVADRNTPRFLLGSRQLFGDVEPELMNLANDILADERAAEKNESTTEMLDAETFAQRAERELTYYRRLDPSFNARVEVRDDIAGIMVSQGNFLIGGAAQVPVDRVDAALAHEIGTHVLTCHNGRQQPFQELRCGMAGYEPLQEGLAVLAEYLSGQLGAGRLRQLAGRVLAVRMVSDGTGFIDTFRVLHKEQGFGAKAAFMITMRTFRGGGYTKDAVYLRGLVKLLDHLAQGHDLQTLYLGKVAQQYLPLIEELRWRRILAPPALLPRLFTLLETAGRRDRLTQGITVLNMLEEAA
jgi:uncharacterized protein (TIGR02421 family)